VRRFATGLVLGLVAGIGAGAGGTYILLERAPSAPAIAPLPPEAETADPRRKRGRRPGAPSSGGGERERASGPTNLALRAEGDTLRAEPTSLDLGAAGGEGPRSLTQLEIDEVFAERAPAIIRCITEARGEAPVTGRVTAGVVAGADGKVVRTRVEAPAHLLENGLAACARRELAGLRFPATGKETVITVPFDLSE
jgi:hypothetical protein